MVQHLKSASPSHFPRGFPIKKRQADAWESFPSSEQHGPQGNHVWDSTDDDSQGWLRNGRDQTRGFAQLSAHPKWLVLRVGVNRVLINGPIIEPFQQSTTSYLLFTRQKNLKQVAFDIVIIYFKRNERLNLIFIRNETSTGLKHKNWYVKNFKLHYGFA